MRDARPAVFLDRIDAVEALNELKALMGAQQWPWEPDASQRATEAIIKLTRLITQAPVGVATAEEGNPFSMEDFCRLFQRRQGKGGIQ